MSDEVVDKHDEATAGGLAALDRLLEHRSRLGACVVLSNADRLSFKRLKQLLQETDGNLGAHLLKLENAGYVDVDKQFENRRPVSWYSLTTQGKSALKTHLDAMQALIQNSSI